MLSRKLLCTAYLCWHIGTAKSVAGQGSAPAGYSYCDLCRGECSSAYLSPLFSDHREYETLMDAWATVYCILLPQPTLSSYMAEVAMARVHCSHASELQPRLSCDKGFLSRSHALPVLANSVRCPTEPCIAMCRRLN